MFVFLPITLIFFAPLGALYWPVSTLLADVHGWPSYLVLTLGAYVWLAIAGLITLVISGFSKKIFLLWIAWDKIGGAVFGGFLDWLFETGPYKFGDEDNTVSAVLGANLHTGQAVWFDWLFTHILDRSPLKIGSTHCKEAYKIEKRKGYGVFARS